MNVLTHPSDLAVARSLLESGNYRFVLVQAGLALHTSTAPGVKPLAEALATLGVNVAGASLADQIVGRAVALLAANARLVAVYGQCVSQNAIEELVRWRIPLEYHTAVEHILNRTGDGLCPFERRVSAIADPAEAAAVLAAFDPRAATKQSPGAAGVITGILHIQEETNMGKTMAVTDASFSTEVLESAQPVLTDFWAEWCGPCKTIAPIIEQLANEFPGQMKVTKLDVDANPQTTMRYGVMSIPTLILFKNGQPVERIVGYQGKDALLRRVRPHLAAS